MLWNPDTSMERCLAETQFLQLAVHNLLLLNGELDSVKCKMKSGISFWIWNCLNYDVFFLNSTNKTLERYQRCCYNPQDANISDRETQVYFLFLAYFLFFITCFINFFMPKGMVLLWQQSENLLLVKLSTIFERNYINVFFFFFF